MRDPLHTIKEALEGWGCERGRSAGCAGVTEIQYDRARFTETPVEPCATCQALAAVAELEGCVILTREEADRVRTCVAWSRAGGASQLLGLLDARLGGTA